MPYLPAKTPLANDDARRLPPALRHQAGAGPLKDACCAPAAGTAMAPPAPLRRAKLSDLDANIHCSIVGTCLTTAELRKLVPRHAIWLDRKTASDLEIHHTAVELSTEGGALAKELTKALDERHALAIKRFKAAADAPALQRLWSAALANGDVPGAYWAVMTHPAGTLALRSTAFGDVHMLSHLVGAANRADIRRLAALEDECAKLKEQNGQQQARWHDLGAQHELALRKLEQQVAALTAQRDQLAAAAPAAAPQLRDTLAEREQQLALHGARRHEAEQKLLLQETAATQLQAELLRLREDGAAAGAEMHAMERALELALTRTPGRAALPQLAGKTIVYVGGRPGANAVLVALVAAAGGELLVHDGGIEDRRGMLATLLPRAHIVVFPVDCISHNAMQITKQACARHGIACHPLRTASVASFVELLQTLAARA